MNEVPQGMQRSDLVQEYPILYHMAEEGTWPSIQARGLLSTRALVDLYNPEPRTRAAILGSVRQSSIVLDDPRFGRVVIRDQRPLKFMAECLRPNTTPEQFLDALNGRVFFWLTSGRLERLLRARLYRKRPHIVLQVDTNELVARYGDTVQLAPYNTGSMHVPNAPQRGRDVFVDIDQYPYEYWRAKRGLHGEAVVELTVPYSVPDIADVVLRVEQWENGEPVKTIFERTVR